MKNKLYLVYHLLAWLILFYLYIQLMQNFLSLDQAILRVTIYLGFMALVFYAHTYFLAPRFFNKKKFIFYLVSIAVLLLISAGANDLYIRYFDVDLGSSPQLKTVHGHRNYIFTGTISTIVCSFIIWFIIKYRAQEQLKKELESQKRTAELAMLKSQINPHFLFNTLNNIYSLSLVKAEPVVSEMILSLSEINRYMLYDAMPDQVPLSNEITYLQNYIELEKLRCENVTNIKFTANNIDEKVEISPLLLIPFVENAFKHSRIADAEGAYIKIDVTVDNDRLLFRCENSVPVTQFSKDKTSGIGLENVKRRLLLLYPEKHELTIDHQERKFIVDLKISL